jgi:hypothetical protein
VSLARTFHISFFVLVEVSFFVLMSLLISRVLRESRKLIYMNLLASVLGFGPF